MFQPRLPTVVPSVVSSTLTSGKYMTGFRDMTSPEITTRAAAQAYERAGVDPKDIDVAERFGNFADAVAAGFEVGHIPLENRNAVGV